MTWGGPVGCGHDSVRSRSQSEAIFSGLRPVRYPLRIDRPRTLTIAVAIDSCQCEGRPGDKGCRSGLPNPPAAGPPTIEWNRDYSVHGARSRDWGCSAWFRRTEYRWQACENCESFRAVRPVSKAWHAPSWGPAREARHAPWRLGLVVTRTDYSSLRYSATGTAPAST